ncbi:MAG: right-handed parallel beta-helix repeat-containing protein [Anaerolineae bacterium]|nr:right-handed parallel beta-helix repeat-containing protein [Anaerolineae bacterium]
MRTRRAAWLSVVVILLTTVSSLFLAPLRVHGATIPVTNTNDSGVGSLRQAILDANSTPELDTITFNIGAGGLQTITPQVALPDITAPVSIDGTTQPGFAGIPLIQIDGTTVTTGGLGINGLTLRGNDSTIRGLIISYFERSILIKTGSGNYVEGSYLGTDATGNTIAGQATVSLWIEDSSNNTIGGLTAAHRNIIVRVGLHSTVGDGTNTSGNKIQGNYIGVGADGNTKLGTSNGVIIFGASGNFVGGSDIGAGNVISGAQSDGIIITSSLAKGNYIEGNYIGTNATGTIALGNGGYGIFIDTAPDTVIGGTTPAARNVIAGNGYGIGLIGDTQGKTIIQGNYIGTDVTGLLDLGNLNDGIKIEHNRNNQIGGTVSGAGNRIMFNHGDGVNIAFNNSTGNQILGNTIFNNGDLGIDLGTNAPVSGVTPNDPDDTDVGGNGLQNFPVLTHIIGNATLTRIVGTFNSLATVQTYRLEFFANTACDVSGNGEGEEYIGFINVTTDALGKAIFNFDAPPTSKHFITATATDPGGNTSEFSRCRTIGDADTIGIFRPSRTAFYLRYDNTTGFANNTVTFGAATDFPVAGDWDGDGRETYGVYRPTTGEFFLTDNAANPAAVTYSFVLGSPGDQPIVGDWDGDGKDGVGVFRPSNGLIYLKNNLTTGFADFTMVLGLPGDIGVAGDWNGDGVSSPGVYRPSNQVFYLTNSVCTCAVIADLEVGLGLAGDTPFVGDWNGDGLSGLGVYRASNGLTYIKNALTTGFADRSFVYGSADDYPLAGHWIRVVVPAFQAGETAPPFQPEPR